MRRLPRRPKLTPRPLRKERIREQVILFGWVLALYDLRVVIYDLRVAFIKIFISLILNENTDNKHLIGTLITFPREVGYACLHDVRYIAISR